jgi:hypothetical protein
MPEIEIYFAGLICHVGSSSAEGSERRTLVRSILIPDANHTSRIRLKKDGIDEILTTGVVFTNLGSFATARSLFSDTVPHLDDLTRSGVNHNPAAAGLSVYLPSGQFTVAQFYDCGAKWDLDGDISIRPCVPRITMLRAEGQGVSISFNNKSVSLASDGWVLITNLEKEPPQIYGEDWKKQYTVTTGTADDIAVYYDLTDNGSCTVDCKKNPEQGTWTPDIVGLLRPVADSSECTNSHWP